MTASSTQARRFSRDEYHQMARAGIFRPDEHVELIDGAIIAATPHSIPHAALIHFLSVELQKGCGGQTSVRVRMPLSLGEDSEPEPDIAVVAGEPLAYMKEHPASALLVVEVADSSLTFDRKEKAVLYAHSNIPEYWILNIPDRQLEVFRTPSGSGYHDTRIVRANEQISPLHAPRLTVPLDLPFLALHHQSNHTRTGCMK